MNDVQCKYEQRSSVRTVLRHQDLHDRLLAAAEAAIASGGLGSLKARTIAESVGCSVGASYGVFADLDALVLEVNGRTLDAIAAKLTAVPTRGGPAEHLVQLAEAYLGYAAENGPRWRALFQHSMPEGRPVTPGLRRTATCRILLHRGSACGVAARLVTCQTDHSGTNAIRRRAWNGGSRARRESDQLEANGVTGASPAGGIRDG